jgi:hypothetical protein
MAFVELISRTFSSKNYFKIRRKKDEKIYFNVFPYAFYDVFGRSSLCPKPDTANKR